jgi:DNA-binding NtrC family response regulator
MNACAKSVWHWPSRSVATPSSADTSSRGPRGSYRFLSVAIERAVVMGAGDLIALEDLPESLTEVKAAPEAGAPGGVAPYHEAINTAKRAIVERALDAAQGTVTEAARLLGLNANYLHRLMNKLGLRQPPRR